MRGQNSFLKTIVFVAVVAVAGYFIVKNTNLFGFPERRGIAGIPAPILKAETGQAAVGEIDGYKATVDYTYSCDMRALVVNERHYSPSSTLDKLAPVSAVLAWGVVAEYNNKIDFGWQQPMRGLATWNAKEDQLAAIGGSKAIYQNSTDAYLVPANDSIREEFRKIKQGDYLHLTGYVGDGYCRKAEDNYIGIGGGDLAKTLKGEDDNFYSVICVTKIEWLK